MSQRDLTRFIQARVDGHLLDESGVPGAGIAIYTLSDPRDVRAARYVGMTRSPRRRLLQHLHTARLWLPDDMPWWFAPPKLRPLYDWVRELHREDYRLPVMLVRAWVESVREARAAERELILAHLGSEQELLNVESEMLDRQLGLAL